MLTVDVELPRMAPTCEQAEPSGVRALPVTWGCKVRYLLTIYQNAEIWNAMLDVERQAVMQEAGEFFEELVDTGEWISGEALADPSTAKGVRVRNGVTEYTDGPYIESREHLAGYLIIECETHDRALAIAARWPEARYFGLEVRPLMTATGEEM
jgi:hypothetical protein